ncbi:pleiotropic regulator 1 [Spodoptera litura]|uniref:Pleiotropic regulator 1 n=1 Tax=Spodoptera litura TaxID=69820 RepID=A0A9J7ECL9_SPOLT|nr:pleiotropic regulator 1 [Spodoptera litura]
MSEEVIKHSVHTLVFRSLKRSHDMFLSNQGLLPPIDDKAEKVLKGVKARDSYGQVMDTVQIAQAVKQQDITRMQTDITSDNGELAETAALGSEAALVPFTGPTPTAAAPSGALAVPRKPPAMPKPKWHAPWKLFRVISGHLGWVRCVAVEPGNEWFATGAADRVIKIWDLASGKLKVSLTGHVSTVRGLEVSSRHPYLFSCGEDRQVKCWDLEYNKVRFSWLCILAFTMSYFQIITGSHDSTIRLWDLAAGKSMCTLTNHKKSVRSIVVHPTLYTFASASPDNIKQWKCPEGKFIQNLSGHNAIVNCMAVNPEGVLVSGGDNGTMYFWDWRTGYNFQRLQAAVQPGSMDSEAGIFAMTFDNSGSRLITTEADKTIKIYREDDTASEETHPINWRPEILKRRKF